MDEITLYKLAPTDDRLIDAVLEFDRIAETASAVILHSRSGGPPRNSEYPEALGRIVAKLVEQNRISAVLIDSSRHAALPRAQRLLFAGEDLADMSAGDAAGAIRQALLKFGQASDTKGGNSTKRVRIETTFPLHSLITSLHVHKVGSRRVETPSNKPVSRKETQQLLGSVPHTEEEVACVENEVRMVAHFRTERSRSSHLPKKKREAVRASNGGRLRCESESCAVDWYTVFPKHIADSVFEVHHRVPLSSDENPVINTIADLQVLCACCHRAEHRKLASL
ncbi:HNH endonuclease [Alteriqipengyuania lutimaris]|uniref:HNH domain-containing protein n=1 Tax=Alteriqipengyuania lutimaris TaxID=1538146 RepID=A0A395LHP5_9SPHN|nr:HNH endonuclease [Alteriqipengyuania lutimaris]MBB3034685.1 hypothetical protein [Alteriqipengyuania lutimaris]RDS76456.1 hypothetical protein DL238_01750 [Alteriqipengyuania lutimaris]